MTTAAPYQPDNGDHGPGADYNGAAKFYQVYSGSTDQVPDLRISHIAYDRKHTSAADMGTWFPLKAMQVLLGEKVFARLSPRFYGLPANRSQRITLEVDCVDVVRLCREVALHVVVLVPNCPVCHQSVSLAARSIEQAGMATIFDGDEQMFASLRAGARGYFLKETPRSQRVAALKGIIEGIPPLSPSIASRIINYLHHHNEAREASRTDREHEVLTFLAMGMNRKKIAEEPDISHYTVSEYIKQIYQKLNVHTSVDASMKAVRMGLVPLD